MKKEGEINNKVLGNSYKGSRGQCRCPLVSEMGSRILCRIKSLTKTNMQRNACVFTHYQLNNMQNKQFCKHFKGT